MIDTTLRATSEKLKPGACSTFGGPRSSSAQKPAKKRSIAARPAARAEVAADGLAALHARRPGCRLDVVEAGA